MDAFVLTQGQFRLEIFIAKTASERSIISVDTSAMRFKLNFRLEFFVAQTTR